MLMLTVIAVALCLIEPIGSAKPQSASVLSIIAMIGGYWAITILLGLMSTGLGLASLRRDALRLGKAHRRRRILNMVRNIWLVAGFAMLLEGGFRQWIFQSGPWVRIPLLVNLAMLSVFIVAVLLHWLIEYPFYRRCRQLTDTRFWRLGAYLLFNTRHHLLLVIVPISIVVLLSDGLVQAWAPLLSSEWLDLGASLLSAGLVFLLAPLVVVRIWKTRPLPAGELREELENLCVELKTGCRDIRIWDTDNVLINAAAVGFTRPMRFLLVSDALLSQSDDRSIRAVFGHELGHAIHRHLPYMVALVAGIVLLSSGLAAGLGQIARTWGFDNADWIEMIAALVLLGIGWFFGFGWVSRQFERQSDVTGAWVSSGGHSDGAVSPEGAIIFANALHQIGVLNSMDLDKWNFRHGRLSGRIRFIETLGRENGSVHAIDRTVRRIKWGIWLILFLGIALNTWIFSIC